MPRTPPCQIPKKSGTGVHHINSWPSNSLRCQRDRRATFFTQEASGTPFGYQEPDPKTHGPDKLEFSPRLWSGNLTRTPTLASRCVPRRTVFLCVLSVLCVSILVLLAGPLPKPIFPPPSNPRP